MPSKNELELFHSSIVSTNTWNNTPFRTSHDKYWSSSEDNFLNSWVVDFDFYMSGGIVYPYSSNPSSLELKNSLCYVRPVRGFSYSPNYSAFVNTSGWNYLLATDSTGCTYDSIYVQLNIGGCMDPAATNFDSTATCDDGSCTLCYTTIDFGTDTLNACDTAVITTAAITNATYSWSRVLDDPFPFGMVQQLLDGGYTPKEIYDQGYPLSLIYGSTYKGGTIFHVDLTTAKTMITTLNEIIVDSLNNIGVLSIFLWGCIGTQIGTSDSIGSCKRNTQLILENCLDRPIAASVASEFQAFGYDDWFLPSKDEMMAIYNNTSYSSNNTSLWTSSEDASQPAIRGCRFYNGIWDEDKDDNFRVLAVREIGNSNTYTAIISGTYYLTITDSLGCSSTDSLYVDIINGGCMDSTACNYDASVSCDNGSCITAYGCMDSTACNYDASATCDDGSCLIAYGCTDPLYLEYDATAQCDDGSCATLIVNGCTDSTASNYNASANVDDGSCFAPMVNLFFSEYAEGSSNNKYLEIFNPTADTVDLLAYAYPSVSNAPSTAGTYEYWNDFDSGAVILPNDVYVIAHGSADPYILSFANETVSYLSNGDDGYALVYGANPGPPMDPATGGYVIMDFIGDWNGDPGTGWDVAGVSTGTKDHTLVRKCDVSQGNSDWTLSAGTNAVNSEWVV